MIKNYQPFPELALGNNTLQVLANNITTKALENQLLLKAPEVFADLTANVLAKIITIEGYNPKFKLKEIYYDFAEPIREFAAFLEYFGAKLIKPRKFIGLPANREANLIYLGKDTPFFPTAYIKIIENEKKVFDIIFNNKEFKACSSNATEWNKFISQKKQSYSNSIKLFKNEIFEEFIVNNMIPTLNDVVYNSNHEVFDPNKDYVATKITNNLCQGGTIVRKDDKNSEFGIIINDYTAGTCKDWDEATKYNPDTDTGPYISPYQAQQYVLGPLSTQTECRTFISKLKIAVEDILEKNGEGTSIMGDLLFNTTEGLVLLIAPDIVTTLNVNLYANTIHPNYLPGFESIGVEYKSFPLLNLHYRDVGKRKKDEKIPPIMLISKKLFKIFVEPSVNYTIPDFRKIGVTDEFFARTSFFQTFSSGYNPFECCVYFYPETQEHVISNKNLKEDFNIYVDPSNSNYDPKQKKVIKKKKN